MEGALIVSIVFGGIVLALAVLGSTFLITIKILKGGFSRKDQMRQNEEARMIQEIYQGLSRMEERVDALETILLDRDPEDRKR